ncbi:hypothetical protein [Methanothermobacter sp.]|uniref:hypothetical protein n=1 Tax=Methanothermobacter sp. TaxID=1884223 RepID=UPI00260F901F|nr:hypothetical protein [Methanothermobacter sp.]MDI9614549.1 hypothetical protein [Methanothermobacter sp.]
MFVAMVPFSTELTGDYGGLVTSRFMFHVNMLMIGLLLSASWFYDYKNGLMDLEREQYLRALKRNLLMPFAAIVALLLTPFTPEYSSIAYAIMFLKRFIDIRPYIGMKSVTCATAIFEFLQNIRALYRPIHRTVF